MVPASSELPQTCATAGPSTDAGVIWRCPQCRGALLASEEALQCKPCARSYPSIAGIPDLRLPGASWIDHEEDRAEARRLIDETAGFTAEQMMRHVFGARKEFDQAWAEKRTRQVLEARNRLLGEVRGWLAPSLPAEGVFLDLGCGAGQLLAAASVCGRPGIGIDVRLVWLIVAQRLILEAGGKPLLAAAMAEALPLADASVRGVISLDVIEHVGDVEAYLCEINRVTAPGGNVAFATPNRFSLAAEPHVSVWGVGWVPRRWQKRYVKLRSGLPYEFTRLLSVSEARRLFRQQTQIAIEPFLPQVPADEIAHFPPLRRTLAHIYNRIIRLKALAPVLLLIGPFFRITGKKASSNR